MSVKFIADIGANHNQQEHRAINAVKIAKQIGCHAVKFQLYKASKLWARMPEVAMKMADWELPEEFLPAIREQCDKSGIEFHCTPFDINAVDTLKPYVDAFKIGSYEILCLDLIRACAETDKPLGISTGLVIKSKELRMILDMLRYYHTDLTIFACDSHYPAKPISGLVSSIARYGRNMSYDGRFKMGWSDHTVEPGVVHGAVTMGAQVVEFHLDPFDDGQESIAGHCWGLTKAQLMIQDVRIHEMAINLEDQEIPRGQGLNEDIKDLRTDPRDYSRPLKKEEPQ